MLEKFNLPKILKRENPTLIYSFGVSIVDFNPLTVNVPIRANQLTGFYMVGTLAVKGLSK